VHAANADQREAPEAIRGTSGMTLLMRGSDASGFGA
jgi:hypothetical protein